MTDLRPTMPLVPELIHPRHIVAGADDTLFGGWGIRVSFSASR